MKEKKMNREIKFRIYDKVNKEYVYSGGTPTMLAVFFRETAILNVRDGKHYEQFTGLKDKDNQDIYQGDTVWYGKKEKVITFNCSQWSISTIDNDTCAGKEIGKNYSLYLEHNECEIKNNKTENAIF